MFFGEVSTVEECLAGCRNLGRDGYPFAGVEYQNECYCGEKPERGFDRLFTWPERCNMRCKGNDAFWENCGGAGAMNLWSVPPAQNTDLAGICVYDHPRDGRVFNRYAESVVEDMSVEKCKNDCFEKGNGSRN